MEKVRNTINQQRTITRVAKSDTQNSPKYLLIEKEVQFSVKNDKATNTSVRTYMLIQCFKPKFQIKRNRSRHSPEHTSRDMFYITKNQRRFTTECSQKCTHRFRHSMNRIKYL